MSTVALSTASLRSGTLEPPSTATNGQNITRADFQRWAHEDRNHAQADMTRNEREDRRKFKQAQKELFRSRGAAAKEAQKEQLHEAQKEVAAAKEEKAAIGVSLREQEEGIRKRRTEQQKKWADHGYELTQQYTIKAAQNNMRSLKAQNAGIVSSMLSKRSERQNIVESQRQAAHEERHQRVERIKSETTDTVTRNAKKAFVDERWDTADAMREQIEGWRAQRKAQELAYLESALAINAATSLEPAKQSREKSKQMKANSSAQMRDRKKQLREQSVADDSSHGQSKAAIHDSIHGLKFVPDDEIKELAKTDGNRFKTFFGPRTVTGSRRKPPYEVTL